MEVRGQGSPLLFAHGLSGDRAQTLRELEPLVETYQIVVFDQRGHGESTPLRDPARFDPHAMASDAAAVLDALGIERAIVGGESMGAATALLFACSRPERVERLLLVAPAFGTQPNPDGARLLALGEEIEREGMDGFLANSAERLRRLHEAPPEVLATIRRMHRAHDPGSLATAFKAVSQWTFEADPSAVAACGIPAAVLAWPGDTTHPIALARDLAASLPGARFQELPGWMEVFRDPEIVGRSLRHILEAGEER